MALPGRSFLPDQPMHVIQRGNNRERTIRARTLGRRVAPLARGRPAKAKAEGRQLNRL